MPHAAGRRGAPRPWENRDRHADRFVLPANPAGAHEPDGGRAASAFARLVAIMARLRGPDGCPWDREQTLESLAPYVLEEAAEVVDAVERGDLPNLREEIGNLLFEGVFLAQLTDESGDFDVAAALDTVSEKLIRCHPHVFDEDATLTPDEVKAQWDVIKAREKAARGAGTRRHPRGRAGEPCPRCAALTTVPQGRDGGFRLARCGGHSRQGGRGTGRAAQGAGFVADRSATLTARRRPSPRCPSGT